MARLSYAVQMFDSGDRRESSAGIVALFDLTHNTWKPNGSTSLTDAANQMPLRFTESWHEMIFRIATFGTNYSRRPE
jgi:hypothetical protein